MLCDDLAILIQPNTNVMLLRISYPTVVTARGETLWASSTLCLLVLQYCNIAVFVWILVRHFVWKYGKEMSIQLSK